MGENSIVELTSRFLAKDSSLWPDGNVSSNRLGWIDVLDEMMSSANNLKEFCNSVDYDKVILLGMGGSSLGPLVLSTSLGNAAKRKVIVSDTTHPKTVSEIDFNNSLVIISSKSGSTLEPNVLFDYAFSKVNDPKRFVAITDPGTSLETLAKEKGFLKIFSNRPDIGGRYSVMSYFGMVPAQLAGYDIVELIENAKSINIKEAVELGIALGNAVKEGRDKITIKVPETFSSLGSWLEQLLAESTGKNGTGCIPIPTCDDEHGSDRFNLELSPKTPQDLASIFYRFEIATAIAGHILAIDPFNEPNVQESKANTNRVLESLPLKDVETIDDVDSFLKNSYNTGDYVSLQAYVAFGQDSELKALRQKIRELLGGAAVTVGYGPRFLHSTGQLHKGGPNSLIALQIIDEAFDFDLKIPSKHYNFATLITAQADGDLESLRSHGRRVARVKTKSIGDLLKSLN